MQIDVTHLAFIVFGVFVGAFAVWYVTRHQAGLAEARGKAIGDIERAQQNEQIKAMSGELADLKSRLVSTEERRDSLQAQLNNHQIERAQFEERALRVPKLEAERLAAAQQLEKIQQECLGLSAQLSAVTARSDGATHRVAELEANLQELTKKREELQREGSTQSAEISRLTEELAAERRNTQDKLMTLQQARQELSDQFKALANDILDEKSKKFAEQNQANLGQLLNPLKDQLTAFKSKVEEVYVNEGKDRSAMAEQVRQLMALNQSLSQDANNLALAIRGDRKAQGNWGEIILDDVLERAGLIRGIHYERQGGLKAEDGLSNVIPDVVIKLPGERHMVVDSKLTLPDYRAFADADTEEEKSAAMKRHLLSIRNHMKGLSEKNYQNLYDLKSLDFVVMFVPLEPAFMLAVTNDRELFQQAWDKNVLLVSPSTLLFVVRTVAYLWRQEGLSRNAKEISTRGAELYDKLAGFVVDFNKVGDRLKQAQDSYHEARSKLSEGKGNVIRQAEMLKQLGVKPSKGLPSDLVQIAMDDAQELLPPSNTTEEK